MNILGETFYESFQYMVGVTAFEITVLLYASTNCQDVCPRALRNMLMYYSQLPPLNHPMLLYPAVNTTAWPAIAAVMAVHTQSGCESLLPCTLTSASCAYRT